LVLNKFPPNGSWKQDGGSGGTKVDRHADSGWLGRCGQGVGGY